MEETNAKSHAMDIDLIVMLRRRWTHLVLGICAGIGLSVLYYLVTTSVYESEIEILVGQRSSEVTNSGTITGANASGDAIKEDQLATHMRLFVGRRLLAEAIQVGNLDQLESFRSAEASGKSAIDHILEHIEVERGGEGGARDAMVLRATFRDPNREDAALVLASIYESYRNYVESHGQNSTEQAVNLIIEARETHEKELNEADQEYRSFVQSVPALIDGEKVQDIHKDRLAAIEPELNLVRSSLAESSARLEVIQSYLEQHDESSIGQHDYLALLSQTEVERLKLFLEMTRDDDQSNANQAEHQEVARVQYNRLLELVQKEKAFTDAFGPGHPMVEAVRQQAEITRQFIEAHAPQKGKSANQKLSPAEMLETYTLLLGNDIAEFEKRKRFLLEESDSELKLAKLVEADYLKGISLKSKLDRARSRYEQVILRLQELSLARSYAGFSTDVLANPEPAKNAAWPKLPIVVAMGCCLGLGLGLVLALGAELIDSTFNSAAELEQAVGAQAIAHVPKFDQQELIRRMDPESLFDPSLVSFHSPRSAESEVYRVARTSLMISNRRGSVQTMMMTSPQPGDGKSTTISNLAISFAKAGKKVVLIDADMRRPMISRLFGIDETFGLADVLEGEIDLSTALVETGVENLLLLPNGLPTSSPAELLESNRFVRLLAEARKEFDLVLIDAPPLLAVADPAIIAPIVDSVILTVRVTKNGRRPVEHAARILHDIDVNPAAVVVNAVEAETNKSYGYGNYSNGQYGYIGHYHERYAARSTEPEKSEQVVSVHDAHPAESTDSKSAASGLGKSQPRSSSVNADEFYG